uniref:Triadin n=1 Tax=Laticauda laticaudata TaxID=8630 RepID=A0A8C5SXX0_LATLA
FSSFCLGPVSTTTVIDNKNGTVPVPHMKMSKRSVSEDFATTFSSPAAWLLVLALIVTWSAVAIVMFDLVDYRTLAGNIHVCCKIIGIHACSRIW